MGKPIHWFLADLNPLRISLPKNRASPERIQPNHASAQAGGAGRDNPSRSAHVIATPNTTITATLRLFDIKKTSNELGTNGIIGADGQLYNSQQPSTR